jgi:hypothetical protein
MPPCVKASWFLQVMLLLLAPVLAPMSAKAAERQYLRGHVPAVADGLQPSGRLPGSNQLRLAIGLPLRNQDTLTNLIQQLYDPASPLFHQYLTPAQFADRFGPAEQDYQALMEFARTNGLKVTGTHPNRVLLDVEGSVADIERTFRLNLLGYQHPKENRMFHAPDVEPSLDLAIPVTVIVGLSDYVLPRPANLVRSIRNITGKAEPFLANGSGPGGDYMGNDFRSAYAPGISLTGTGQVLGLFELDGYYANDITLYESTASLPAVPLQNVLVDAVSGTPGYSGNSTYNEEVALDIEMAISMAPGLSRVMVYEGPLSSTGAYDTLNRMATDNLAKQLSSSWVLEEIITSLTLPESIYQQFAAQGQSFFQASGDQGAYYSGIYQYSDDPYITIVGGTKLTTTGPGGAWQSETTWNDGYDSATKQYWASGGGVSVNFSIPTWQLGINMSANLGSTTKRNSPDVAMIARDILLIADNGSTYSSGGTSAAAPLWAGFTALVNQQAVSSGKSTVGFVNPAVYNVGKWVNFPAAFHDITTGNNVTQQSSGKYPAVTGYDLCTGWGTPAGQVLIDALSGSVPILLGAGSNLLFESCTPANGVIDPGETVAMNFTLQNVGGASTTNLVATLLAANGVVSPGAAQSYGVVPASGGTATRTFTFTAGGSCGGTVIAALQLQDGSAVLGNISFPLSLGTAASYTQTQNFDGVIPPALPSGWSNVLVSGTQTTWATTTASFDTSPNSVFIADSPNAGENSLVSPAFSIVSPSAQLTFRQNHTFESRNRFGGTTYYDGGVLEIRIGNGAFTDILLAGGSFVTGGYNCVIASGNGNPLSGQSAWGGISSWATTTVNLPAAAAGQYVQFRWSCGTSSANRYTAVGWYVDTISLKDVSFMCCTGLVAIAPSITWQPTNVVALQGSAVSFLTSATGTPTPAYQWFFNTTNLLIGQTNSLLTLTNVQLSQAGGYSVVAVNAAGSETSAVALLTVFVPPAISLPPTNTTVLQGNDASFYVAATGIPDPAYQWYYNLTNLLNGAASSTLTLTNAQSWQMGGYFVVVTNIAGVVTSSVAQLTVLAPPVINLNGLDTIAGTISISLSSQTGLNYVLEYKDSLTDTNNWTPAGTPVPGTGDMIYLLDINAPPASRFYRVSAY